MAFFRNFKKSFEELKSIRCLTVTALLIGVSVALKFVMIMPSETLKISFAFVGLAAIGMLYGPVVAGLAGVVTDVIGFLVKPTGAFSPIFTLVEVAGAVIYGIFLNTIAMVIMGYFAPEVFWVKITTRIVKNLTMLPIEVFILLLVLYPVMVAYRAAFREKRSA